MLGTGRIRLTDGEMDLQFKTAQREGLGIDISGLADGMIRLTGTPQEPKIELEVGELVVRGFVAWATGGISIVAEAIFNRLTAAANPCEKVLTPAG